ncbi:S-layer homology domain-containing protein [Bacillus solimangrovi]|uniref:SLH domain-containing protein n=1 Tax=Bacillus solimangrovi TaxID=1305675 RepID=A0A1E5LAM0_9BACI|nr:S-layer homology domain-containing protein [Bacillus solimangrovi]OEH91122.1 hypothetical protein BFG57_07050 [Bacillus solimangrovi]
MKKFWFVALSFILLIVTGHTASAAQSDNGSEAQNLLNSNEAGSSKVVKTVFSDVPSDHWAKSEIDYLVEEGAIKGYDDETFRPNEFVTRGQSALIIGRTLDIDTSNRTNPNFSDVSTESYLYPYISALVYEGVFAKAEKFNPNSILTRAQMAKTLVEAFDIEGESSKEFTDVTSNHWAYSYVQTLAATGITKGKTPTTFDPNGEVTRAQMVVFVKRTLDYLVLKEELLPMAEEAISLANEERANAGLTPLTLNLDITKAAQLKAEDLRNHDNLTHDSPTYGRSYELLERFNIENEYSTENAGAGQTTVKEYIEDVMNSEKHRKNMLDPHITDMGIGFAKKDSYYYIVQIFIQK